MPDFEPHKIIEDLLPAKGIGYATIVFYLWFASRYPRGAKRELIENDYNVGRRQAFRYVEKLTDLGMMKKKTVHGRAVYVPQF